MKWIKANPIIAILILIIVILIILYIVKKNKSKTSTTVNTSVFPLHYSSTGPEVLVVQKYLNANNNCGIAPDGIFGKDTESCVQDIFGTPVVDQTTYNKILSDSTISQLQYLSAQVTQDLGGLFAGF